MADPEPFEVADPEPDEVPEPDEDVPELDFP